MGLMDDWTPNTTDSAHKRYRYGTQPQIVHWNLFQLANAIYPLIDEAEPLETILNDYPKEAEAAYLNMLRSKLGLKKEDKKDILLIEELENVLQLSETDMTIFFRKLANLKKANTEDWMSVIEEAFYKPTEILETIKERWKNWFKTYRERLVVESLTDDQRKIEMNKVNPKYVLRNYMAQLAIDAANKRDYSIVNELFNLLKKPYDEQSELKKWFAKRPEWARHKIGCSMLSCSS